MRAFCWLLLGFLAVSPSLQAQDSVGLIPKAHKPITLDGKLNDWEGAFITPVHVGHPDFANRGCQFLYQWDEQALYIGMRCLDQTPAHVGPDSAIYNGDAVEFYLDTRSGNELGGKDFTPGTLHMFWTPFTKSEIKPRWQLRGFKTNPGQKLEGVEVAGARTSWGWTCEFKLPWKNFPNFKLAPEVVVGIDCELCSSDGGLRVDRTFVYSSPTSVSTPSTFGRVRLVDKLEPGALKACSQVLLPTSLTVTSNFPSLHATVTPSPTLTALKATTRLTLLKPGGDRLKPGAQRSTEVDRVFRIERASWELYNLPPGTLRLLVEAVAPDGQVLAARTLPFVR